MLGGRPARLRGVRDLPRIPRLRSRTKPRKALPVRELTRVAVPLDSYLIYYFVHGDIQANYELLQHHRSYLLPSLGK